MDMYVGWTTVQSTTGRNPALCLFCLRPLTEMGVRESLRHRHYLRESMGYLGPSHNWRQSLRWQRHSLLWPLTLGHQDLPHCYLETLCLRLSFSNCFEHSWGKHSWSRQRARLEGIGVGSVQHIPRGKSSQFLAAERMSHCHHAQHVEAHWNLL